MSDEVEKGDQRLGSRRFSGRGLVVAACADSALLGKRLHVLRRVELVGECVAVFDYSGGRVYVVDTGYELHHIAVADYESLFQPGGVFAEIGNLPIEGQER